MKKLPFTKKDLKGILSEHSTPFYIYDEKGIRDNIRRLKRAFSWNLGFKEYFAVKSTPTPAILQIFKEEGCGAECASKTELMLAQACGFRGEDVILTSNATPAEEFRRAKNMGSIINLDDISHIDFLKECAGIPDLICLRYNPGGIFKFEDKLNFNFVESKFGFMKEQLFDGVNQLKEMGVKRFGIHAQLGFHRTEAEFIGNNARLLFELAVELYKRTGVRVEFVNLAGGIGIPHRPEEPAADIEAIGECIKKAYDEVIVAAGLQPIALYTELGIFMTGPYGYFVSSVLHVKKTYKQFIGLDASTNSFMSPARYNDYHHISVIGKEEAELCNTYDITGALCENRDKFAVNRAMPVVDRGDLLVFHDAGAYAYSHSYNFNGKLRPAEFLLCEDNTMRLIRRAETPEDYFSTLDFIKLEYDKDNH